MGTKWFIIGISGATCGGKTTIANKLKVIFPNTRVISQDDYFLPVDDDRHVWIPELNHINFDVLTSLDMDKMYADVKKIVSSKSRFDEAELENTFLPNYTSDSLQDRVVTRLFEMKVNILILEGFCIFYHKPIQGMCNLKYFVTLNKEECYRRRMNRVYEPPDCPGYFEHCVWPEYLQQLEDVKNNIEGVRYISEYTEDPVAVIVEDIGQIFKCHGD